MIFAGNYYCLTMKIKPMIAILYAEYDHAHK